jgi:PKD repeat protein
MTLSYSFDGNTVGGYTYNVTCSSGPCSDIDSGTVTVVAACTANAPDFSICQGTTTVDDALFISNGADCSAGCSMTLSYSFDGNTVGNYTYNVTCSNGVCLDDTATGNVTVLEAPTAAFSANVTSGCAPLTVLFTDLSTGSPTSWNWAFGDGGTSTDQNPSHTYNTPGAYNVTLTVSNACGSDTKTKIDYITIFEAPLAAFSATPTSGCAPLTVNFTDLSTGNPTSWNWTFGDGGTSSAQNPSHQYASAGTYTVTLNVTNECGWNSTIGYITAQDCAVVGGGAEGEERCSFDIDMLGEVTTVRITCCDSRVIESCVAPDPDDIHFLEVDRDIQVICTACPACGGSAPEVIVMTLADEVPSVPEGTAMVGPAYDFTGYINDSACPVFFSGPITIVLSYDPAELPEDTISLAIAYYDDEGSDWVGLSPDTGRVAEIGKATGLIDHFSTVAVLAQLAPAPPPPLAPANFVASDLTIVPSVRKIWEPITFVTRTGESVTITANVVNDGGQQGTYIVELKLNGQTLDTREVTLAVGQSQQVNFTLSGMDYGQYQVEVAELSGEFTVWRGINWWLIIGIIVAVGLIAWGVIWGRRRKKAAQSEGQAQTS